MFFKWTSPFFIQCFVTAGVAINVGNLGLVFGFSTILLPQLMQPGSIITIDDTSGSWIASVPGIATCIGNIVVPVIMSRYGRKLTNIISLIVMIVGWLGIVFARNVSVLIIARVLQGISVGMMVGNGSLMIGEYASPKYRGFFLTTVSLCIGIGVFAIHAMGMYLTWQTSAIICIVFAVVNLIIVLYSPETPTFLAQQGKYDQCRKTFRYLRGVDEEEELEKMISASIIIRNNKEKGSEEGIKKMKLYFIYLKITMTKKVIYKPIIIVIHLFIMSQWSGVNTLTAYTTDVFNKVAGPGEFNMPVVIIILDLQRILSSFISLVVIKKFRRRIMFFVFVSLNIIFLIILTVYTYAKDNGWLIYDHYIIGVLLLYVLMVTVAGTLVLAFVIAGEILPMEHKAVCGGISTLAFSINIFLSIKTASFLFYDIGMYSSFLISAIMLIYGIVVIGVMLPETKDRTLQDIEEEFRGKPFP